MIFRIIFVAIFPIILSAPAFAIQTGKAAPNFSLPSSDGKTYKLSDQRGKVVILEWLNHGCPFVKKHYNERHKNMQKLQKKYTGKEVVWLSIISSAEGKQGYSTPAKANADRKDKGAKSTAILIDKFGKVGKMYDAKTTPHMFVINPKGMLVYQGAIDNKPSADPEDIPGATNYVTMALDWAISPASAKDSFSPASTKPYGCSVKY